MSWIISVSRSAADGILYCHAQTLAGKQLALPIHQIPGQIDPRGASRAATLDSRHHTLDNVALYLDLMGWGELPARGQSLHRFKAPNGEIWIPSQLLVQSFFCEIPPLSQRLFCPSPPTSFCRPVYGSIASEIEASPKPRRSYIWESGVAGQRLGWLVHSKSALRSWSSTYRNALEGRLECAMPRGVLECWLRGAAFNGIFCVTSMKVASVFCDDIYTRENERTQVFHWSRRAQQLKTYVEYIQERSNVHQSQSSEVSDAQVQEVLELMYSQDLPNSRRTRLKQTAALKRQLNILKLKEQTHCRWAEVPGDKADMQYARRRLGNLKRTQQWEGVRKILLNRSQECSQ